MNARTVAVLLAAAGLAGFASSRLPRIHVMTEHQVDELAQRYFERGRETGGRAVAALDAYIAAGPAPHLRVVGGDS